MLHHLEHQVVLTGMTIWMTSCPPNHGLEHLMFLPLYMNLEPEKREGKSRGSSSNAALPTAAPSVNWDDDLDDFMT